MHCSYVLGITPLITNEVGINTHPAVGGMKKEELPMALLNSQLTKLHRLDDNKSLNNATTFFAVPNDRAASLKPFLRYEKYLYAPLQLSLCVNIKKLTSSAFQDSVYRSSASQLR